MTNDMSGGAIQAKPKRRTARKTSTAPTRIYSYRCLPPITEPARVEDQFWLAAQYRNTLVEIEHDLRARLRDVQLAHPVIGPALHSFEEAQRAVEDALGAIRAAKSGTADPDLAEPRSRLTTERARRAAAISSLRESKHGSVELGKLKAASTRAANEMNDATREETREAYEAARARSPVDVALLDGYEEARRVTHAQQLAARKTYSERGLRHGAYVRIEDAVKRAAASTKRPLRFERYDGSGSIGTQLTGRKGAEVLGMTLGELMSMADPRLRLGPPGATDAHPRSEVAACVLDPSIQTVPCSEVASWGAAQRLPRSVRRHAARTWVDLRIGSNPDRSPIFARFPVTIHRLPPQDAVIKWAHVVRRRVGHRLEWRLQFTLESRTLDRPPVAIGSGVCAINLGWRRLLDENGQVIGLRAAYVVDQDGSEREIRVPDYVPSHGELRTRPALGAVGKCDDLARIRDQALERAQLALSTWIADRGGMPPEWQIPETPGADGAPRRSMADRIRGYAAWRAAWKLRRFIDSWKTRRVTGDEQAFAALTAWAKQDRHLETWQTTMRDHQIAHRREMWRLVATELCRRYATILVGAGKLTDVDGWERPAPEDGDPADGRVQRRMARIAAPGEILQELQKSAWKTGAEIRRCDESYATQACALCGSSDPWNAAPRVAHQCAACGATWDQDANHCRNLLARAGFASGVMQGLRERPLAGIRQSKSGGNPRSMTSDRRRDER